MQTPEDEPIALPQAEATRPLHEPSGAVAPVWHTLVLAAGVVLLSLQGANQLTGKNGAQINRLLTYGFTAATELFMVGWVYLGLRLRKIPFRSLFGSVSGGFRAFMADAGFALVFWIASLTALGTIGIFWTVTETAIAHRSLLPQAGRPMQPGPSEEQALHTLTALVPTNGEEAIAWVLLCLTAGFAEELIFRGYFQRQFTAWSRGAIVFGVMLSAAMFGAAHGYQGARNMVLLAIFGVLFSLLTLFRRGLRAAMIAHSWHDLFAGLMLALLKAHHRI